ncbi:MAG: hypothetical protein K6F51_10250 [Acetatifactor sp.]|nr:hypothetical protein [Acetatifactor sp.]
MEQEKNELDLEEGHKRYYLFGMLISHSMDEFPEGEYRLQYGERILNFRLVLQQNEAW